MSLDLTKYKIPIIAGATASGKTAISVELAEKFGFEIISADSRQFFKEMDIGTAKPTARETKGIPHHFIDFLPVTDEMYNSWQFGEEARLVISQIIIRGNYPLIVGGSGLYIQSLVHGFFDDLGISDEEKRLFRIEIEKKDLNLCYDELVRIDPDYAYSIPNSNKQRIHRALEVFYLSGEKMSELHKKHMESTFFKPLYLGLEWEREVLYDRINSRVDQMMEDGLLDEIKQIIDKYGYDLKRLNKTIGYREFIPFLRNECTLEDSVNEVKKLTRHFAKRQITWFKRLDNFRWLKPELGLFKEVIQRELGL
ncbi:MAG: tRNA (adenosine(37)-N6)-dimethylallyltransferase MiaA [Candidatus Delongbacteria bacterium]|nr:tRNA (adenosine(37)-N6)-dimethylallyltransferase MiaA [Candidatus Delongbacteria bacterium]MBN2833780.1 tRNA (adenosine(37)-N6)-dimethylallyltransferase MiaA [Candidatus Delongbacteria bacterium]